MTVVLLALLAAMAAGLVYVLFFQADPPGDGCPSCAHDCGHTDNRHCAEVDHASGMASTSCGCTNEYHWRTAAA